MTIFTTVRRISLPVPVTGEFEQDCRDILDNLIKRGSICTSSILEKMNQMDRIITELEHREIADIVAMLQSRIPEALNNWRFEAVD